MSLVVLAFDSEPDRAHALGQSLREAGHAAIEASELSEVEGRIRPDAIVVGGSGGRETPVVRGLVSKLGPGIPLIEAGPGLEGELDRVAATIRRPRLRLSEVLVDVDAQLAVREGQVLRLSDMEARLLAWLVQSNEAVESRESLLEHVWEVHPRSSTRTVDNTVRRLRTKIELDPSSPRHLVTVHGEGYRLVGVQSMAPPPPPTPSHGDLLGRAEALVDLDREVAAHPLVTVLGPAGIGKTSLVRTWAQGRPGVRFVDCTSALTPDDVAARAAEQLQVAVAQIPTTLASGGLTVILDNVEQIAESLPSLLDAWSHPAGRLILTSRVRIRHRDEVVFELAGLDVPDAVALLRRAGRSRRASFATREGSDDHLAALAVRLDGMPLALELAAARARVLSAKDLLLRVNEGTKVLRHDDATRDDRQRTLEGALQWSWDLLDEDERRALSAWSVFRGGFDAAAAEAVLGQDALDLLEALVDHSLVEVQADADPVRFGMLYGIREFAAARLTDEALARERHAAWFQRCAGPRFEAAEGPDAWAAMAQIRDDRENVLAATRYCIERDQYPRAAEILLTLGALWNIEIPPEREQALLVEVGPHVDDAELGARLWFYLGGGRISSGDQDGAEAALAQGERVARTGGETARALVHLVAGHVATFRTDLEEARARFESALEAPGKLVYEVAARLSLGNLYVNTDQHQRAEQSMEAALARAQAPWQALSARGLLGAIYLAQHRYAEVPQILEPVAEERRRAGQLFQLGGTLANLGYARIYLLDFEGALADLEESRDHFEALGLRPGRSHVGSLLARVYRLMGDPGKAIVEARETIRMEQMMERPFIEAFARIQAAYALHDLGSLAAAGRMADGAVEVADRSGVHRPRVAARHVRALVQLALGHADLALDDLVEGIGLADEVDYSDRAALEADLAVTHRTLGNLVEAGRFAARARGAGTSSPLVTRYVARRLGTP